MDRPVSYDVRAILRPAKALIIVPPFANIDRPSLGVHLLQALARRAGFEVQVLYANMLFAAYAGADTFETIAKNTNYQFAGERLFARAAYGVPPMGYDRGAAIDVVFGYLKHPLLTAKGMLALEAAVDGYLESFVPAIGEARYDVVGCSSSFEQNAASIAILSRLKREHREPITIMGGANCEGEMAEGLATLTRDVDYFFDGESEATFVAFLEQLARGERPAGRTIHGTPCQDLDALPTPDYTDYYTQLRAWLPDTGWAKGLIYLNYETSRGCWWGQKSHCTFCGLNGNGMAMREKSADRAIADLKTLLDGHIGRRIVLTDNIMPHAYWKTLLPRMAAELPGVDVMYEQKANLTLKQVNLLADAGIHSIQPGIEALSTDLLRLMAKGTTCTQNLALMRYAAANGVKLFWNMLTGFPNDRLEFYLETIELLPLIIHLNPPSSRNPVVIDRFSPYHERPERYGIAQLQPYASYRQFLPLGAQADKIAYHFAAEFPSESNANPGAMAALDRAVKAWRDAFFSARPPVLSVTPAAGGRYQLTDTRGLRGLPEHQLIDEAQAIAALVTRPLSARERPGDAWARAHRVVVERDRKQVALAVAPRDLLGAFEDRFGKTGLVTLASDEVAAGAP